MGTFREDLFVRKPLPQVSSDKQLEACCFCDQSSASFSSRDLLWGIGIVYPSAVAVARQVLLEHSLHNGFKRTPQQPEPMELKALSQDAACRSRRVPGLRVDMWPSLKKPVPKWNPWKHGPKPAVCPSCLILSSPSSHIRVWNSGFGGFLRPVSHAPQSLHPKKMPVDATAVSAQTNIRCTPFRALPQNPSA